MQKISTRQLTLSALFIAMVTVLEVYAITLPNFKFTLSSFPVFVGALLFGPLEGLLVGGLGTLLSQMITYGLMPTTIIWVIPHLVGGVLTGLYGKKKGFYYTGKDLRIFLIVMELLITGMNTLSLYVDGHIYGYYTPEFITIPLIPRLLVAAAKGFVFGLILPSLLKTIQKKLD